MPRPHLPAFLLTTVLAAVPALAANIPVAAGPSSSFAPAHIVIRAGDRVTWTNLGGLHNVAADDGSFRCANGCDATGGDGDPSSAAWVASVDFFAPDLAPYHCEIHGAAGGVGMSGSVTVRRSIFADGFEGGDELEWGADALGGSCLGGSPIVLSLPTVGLAGNLRGALNRLDLTGESSCFEDPAPGRDRVYSAAVDSGQTYDIVVTPVDPGFDPVVYLLADGTCGAQPLACLDSQAASGPGVAESMQWTAGASGTLLIVIDSLTEAVAGSDYTLDVAVAP